jgi:hypothetical protein
MFGHRDFTNTWQIRIPGIPWYAKVNDRYGKLFRTATFMKGEEKILQRLVRSNAKVVIKIL